MEELTFFSFAVLTTILLYLVTKYTYWKRKNVPSPIPIPFLGNYTDFFMMKKTVGETVQDIYNKYPKATFVCAYYGTVPVLIPKDPEMIKTILTKDFHKFNGRLLVDHEFRDPFSSSNLFMTSGDSWRTLRQNLNPIFTSGKLKHLFGHVSECGERLDKFLDELHKQSPEQDFKDIATRFLLEAVGTTLFGVKFEAMIPGECNLVKLADKLERISHSTFIKNNIRETWPNLYHLFTNSSPVFENFDKIFNDIAKQSFESRNYKPIGRNDLIDFLLKFKEQGYIEGDGVKDDFGETRKVKVEVTEPFLLSQVLVFFAAGFSTSSQAISFTLYELAKNPQIQQRLVNEIEEVLNKTDGEITYESIQEMKYLDMVVSETLRKYPVLGVVTRECVGDYKFLKDGLSVEKGLRVHIPVWAIHYDPKYYPEPEKFDPERFSPEQVSKRPPYTFLAFGEGQRICIGMRFSKVQVGLGLVRILRRFQISECSRTPKHLAFDPKAIITISKDPLLLKMVPRKILLCDGPRFCA